GGVAGGAWVGPGAAGPTGRSVPWTRYVPADFDVRVPAFAERPDATIQIPRVDGRAVPPRDLRGWTAAITSPEREAERALTALLDGPVAERAAKLQRALDLDRRAAYLRALAGDSGIAARWHEFHVYNWPAPPRAILRLVVYDAADLDRSRSPLRALQDLGPRPALMAGDALIAWARSIVDD